MKPYNNLPEQQYAVRQLTDRFNADERLWRSLEGKRKQRRKLHPRLSAKQHKRLDLLEFANARPPQDCIGLYTKEPRARYATRRVVGQA